MVFYFRVRAMGRTDEIVAFGELCILSQMRFLITGFGRVYLA